MRGVLVAVFTLALAGCIDGPASADVFTGVQPGDDAVEQGPDHVRIRSDHMSGAATVALRAWAPDSAACTGWFSVVSEGRGGIWAWSEDSLGGLDGTVYAGPGAHTPFVDVQLVNDRTPLRSTHFIDHAAFTGERWLWFHAPAMLPDTDPRDEGAQDIIPNFLLDVSCPGARLEVLLGEEAHSLHWMATGEASAAVIEPYGTMVATDEDFTVSADRSRFTLLPHGGTNTVVVLESDQGRTLHTIGQEQINYDLAAGAYTLRVASDGTPPIGIVMQAMPMALEDWYLERIAHRDAGL